MNPLASWNISHVSNHKVWYKFKKELILFILLFSGTFWKHWGGGYCRWQSTPYPGSHLDHYFALPNSRHCRWSGMFLQSFSKYKSWPECSTCGSFFVLIGSIDPYMFWGDFYFLSNLREVFWVVLLFCINYLHNLDASITSSVKRFFWWAILFFFLWTQDEEDEDSEKKSAKDALLLWCQRKTAG